MACAFKPRFALLLLWGWLWCERRFVAGILVALTPLAALSLLRYGLHNNIGYLSVLSFLSRHGEAYFANNSINGILNWYLSPGDSLHFDVFAFTPYNPVVYVGTMLASCAFLGVLVAPPLLRRGQRAQLTDLSAAAICTVLSSPVAWEHHYGILLPLY